ncbi:MAG: TIGR02444 family protein [Parvularculaceae bacterium]|nr:TIGR02444 family protein [Parvularculaceae bacterium]
MTRAESFWDWSLNRYARAKPTLIALQDQYGFNVNMLLWCAWRGAAGDALDPARVGAALAAIARWHETVTRPIRTARRRLAEFGADGAELKPRASALELEAERIEQRILETHASTAGGAPLPAPATALANLKLYAALAGGGRNAAYAEQLEALAASLTDA